METRYLLRDTFYIFALFAPIFTGCGRPAHELDTAPVSGRVTFDGKALPQGIVYALPSKGRMAKGLIQQDGTFELSTYSDGDGVQVGKHPLIVTALPADELDGPEKKLRVPVPRRYARPGTSGLTIDVQAGKDNEIELALSSEDGKQ